MRIVGDALVAFRVDQREVTLCERRFLVVAEEWLSLRVVRSLMWIWRRCVVVPLILISGVFSILDLLYFFMESYLLMVERLRYRLG